MSIRNAIILSAGLIALGAASAHAQDDRYRKTDDGRYGDDRYDDDDRLYKDDGRYDEEDYDDDDYYDQGYGGQRGAMNQRMRGMDRNRDGRITRSEWRGNDRAFERLDRNGDGVLAGRELRANGRRRNGNGRDRDTRIDSLADDRNRDGVVSRREWRGDRDDFDRLDTNRDGYLTSSEARRARY